MTIMYRLRRKYWPPKLRISDLAKNEYATQYARSKGSKQQKTGTHTYPVREILGNRQDVVIENKKDKICLADRNVIQKRLEGN